MVDLLGFIARYTGKRVGYPVGMWDGECLSLVKQYIEESFGFAPPPSGVLAAWGYWTNFPAPLGDYFEKIPLVYDSGVLPEEGDIPIWEKCEVAPNGHIAIYVIGDGERLVSFDQNWDAFVPLNRPESRRAHLQLHDWSHILGWLHPKGGA